MNEEIKFLIEKVVYYNEKVKIYYKITNKQASRHLYDLIISMSKTQYMCKKDEEE